MKKILITTDFSKHSKNTIKYVLNLFQTSQIPCQITLLNTYVVQQTDAKQVITMNDEMKRKSKEGLLAEEIEAKKLLNNSHISINTTSHMGSLKNVIWQLLKKEKIDLVAMGKDGGKHVETIQTLLKEEECPLLITYLAE